jgi:hypothetical protein
MSYIVVEDRTGEWWDGALVDDVRAKQLEARGVLLLPVIPDLFRKSGVGGYAKRSWGAGWLLDALSPRIICPMTMFCSQAYSTLNWIAKILPTDELVTRLKQASPEQLQGFVKICGDSGQAISYQAGIVPKEDVLIKDLLKKDLTEDGAFILRGTARLSLPADTHYGFGLYAMAPGIRVVWSAISQSHS